MSRDDGIWVSMDMVMDEHGLGWLIHWWHLLLFWPGNWGKSQLISVNCQAPTTIRKSTLRILSPACQNNYCMYYVNWDGLESIFCFLFWLDTSILFQRWL
jgi:hypothetical protein